MTLQCFYDGLIQIVYWPMVWWTNCWFLITHHDGLGLGFNSWWMSRCSSVGLIIRGNCTCASNRPIPQSIITIRFCQRFYGRLANVRRNLFWTNSGGSWDKFRSWLFCSRDQNRTESCDQMPICKSEIHTFLPPDGRWIFAPSNSGSGLGSRTFFLPLVVFLLFTCVASSALRNNPTIVMQRWTTRQKRKIKFNKCSQGQVFTTIVATFPTLLFSPLSLSFLTSVTKSTLFESGKFTFVCQFTRRCLLFEFALLNRAVSFVNRLTLLWC